MEKCLVYNCQNHMNEGEGKTLFIPDNSGALHMKWICNPCYFALIEPNGNYSPKYSQVYRNMQLPEEECDHDWQVIEDWEGDPSIPNGTRDCSFLRCRTCDEENYDVETLNEIIESRLDV